VSRPKQPERRELWRQRIAQQESSGQSVRAFCRDHKLSEHSFYLWRRQLEAPGSKPVSFALVETNKPSQAPVELILTSGETLRIPADAGTLRLVLSVLQNKPV
jgi:transposase-like protein